MKVVIVVQPTVGGAAVHVHQLILAALARGYEIELVTPDEGKLPGWAAKAGVQTHFLPLVRSFDTRDLRHFFALRRVFLEADLVHLHSSKAGALGRIVLLSLGKRRPPSVFTPHGWSWSVGGFAAPAYRFLESRLSRVSVILAVSEYEADEGRALFPRARIVTTPNGIDVDHFTSVGERVKSRHNYCVLVVGRLSRAKGQDLALRAASMLDRADVEWRFVGEGETHRALEALGRNLLLTNASFIGETDPAPHFRAADLVVVPSRWDACSLVLLEALCTETPVLASKFVGAAYAFPEGVHLLDELSPGKIAESVQWLLDDTQERRRGLHEASRTVRRSWSWECKLPAVLDVYEELLRKDQPPLVPDKR